MNRTPCLSVVVPNYNNGRYIAECLESVLGQTFKDLEIVVFDDGSSDGSLEILTGLAQSAPGRIRVLHDPVNRGVVHARRQAIAAARGDYLTTLDSDDYYYHPQKLEWEMALIRKVEAEEGKQVMAFSNVILLRDGAPPRLWATPEKIRQGMIACEILSRSCFIPHFFIMRREWYAQAGGYDPRFRIYEDWDLKIRLALSHEFRFTGEVGAAYRRHGRGLSSLPAGEHEKYLRLVFDKNSGRLPFLQRRRARKGLAGYISSLRKSTAAPASRE